MPRKPSSRIFRGTPRNLSYLARCLRAGDIVGVPTETVYGLAADALNPRACQKVFTAKGRPTSDPLIVHIATLTELDTIAIPNAAAFRLAKKFWPGPLTLILPKKPVVPAIVSAGLSSVAVRMPSHRLFRRLIQLSGRPLAAPSANPFGYISPTTAEHVRACLGSKIDFILDGGPAYIGLESTIIDLRNPARPRLLRPGAISREAIAAALGRPVAWPRAKTAAPSQAQVAPGSLTRHYSPRTSLVLHTRITPALIAKSGPNEAFLYIAKPAGKTAKNIYWLDTHGNLHGAARRLFAHLRTLDTTGYSRIHAEYASGQGPADAINDRLRRAAAV